MATKGTKKITLQISGMTCALCVAHNAKTLGELPGVEKVVVNLATDKATVEYDPAKTTLEEVVRAALGDGRDKDNGDRWRPRAPRRSPFRSVA